MAHGTRRRRSNERGSARGGRRSTEGGRARGGRSAGRRGGGSNAGPIVATLVAVVAIIAVLVVVSGKRHKKKEAWVSDELTADSTVDQGPAQAKRPERPPPPEISDEIRARAKQVIEEIQEDRAKGDALYNEGMAAKESGDRDLWEKKLKEAKGYFLNIRDRWNEIEGMIDEKLPMGSPWGADEVANHWLGKEADKITKALEPLAYIKKQLGLH